MPSFETLGNFTRDYSSHSPILYLVPSVTWNKTACLSTGTPSFNPTSDVLQLGHHVFGKKSRNLTAKMNELVYGLEG